MESQNVKKAIRYLTMFFKDVAQLFARLERELNATAGLAPHPKSGNRTSWAVSSHMQYPESWILQDLHRVYVSSEKSAHDDGNYKGCLVCMLSLNPEGLIAEPALLCAWLRFPRALTGGEVYDNVWKSEYFRSFDAEDTCWSASEKPACAGRLVTLAHRDGEYGEKYVKAARLFAVDVTIVSNSAQVRDLIVEPLRAILRGQEPELRHALVFPEELVQAWMRSA